MSTPEILVVDDEADIRTLLKEILTDEGYEVAVASDAGEARLAWDSSVPDLVLLDIWMPDTDGITLLREWSENDGLGCPVVMMSGHGTVDTAVEATRLGAFDFVEKPLSLAKLLRTVERALEEGNSTRGPSRSLLPPMVAPIGKSQLMQALREQVQRVAPHDTAVMFVGEPGTGREAFARYLHSESSHNKAKMITLIGGSLTDSNVEQQLYGSESNGVIKVGILENANGGSLFISDAQDLGNRAQMLLLSAIEQGEFQRVGGSEPVRVKIRLMSSVTPGFGQNQDDGFRPDLLAHLNVIRLRIPPLRDYAEDVPDLLRYYTDKLVDTEGLGFRRFSVAAQNRLRNYPWPGNVRELKNLVQRMLIMDGTEEIGLEEIEKDLESDDTAAEPLVKQDLLALPLRDAREQFERAYLQQQLLLCGGKVGQLAKRVGMERTHLYRKLRSLGVDFKQAGDDG